MIKHTTYSLDQFGVQIQLSEFTSESGRTSLHAMFHVVPDGQLFENQFSRICQAYDWLLSQYPDARPQFSRLFLSDATNQAPLIHDTIHFLQSRTIHYSLFTIHSDAVGYVQQPPLDGSKVALWTHLVINETDTALGLRHLWHMGLTSPQGTSYDQTRTLLEDYQQQLRDRQATFADNCVRTWFFVRDVDTQYKGLVDARRDNFLIENLTPQTHYISSTGIGGLPADTHAIVQMDAYSVLGLRPGQQRYLYAKSHLNPTYEYGVTFERGTAVTYPDRTEYFISGTASIDNKGNVLYVGDIVRQTERMLENVFQLLHEGGADFSDVMQIIVYLRDIADYPVVRRIFSERFPQMPLVITYAPVCRPAWLIEMECMAVKQNDAPDNLSD